ncbi:cytochrome c [Pollutimonas bauzanensis]|jgi:cytochrome c553|uniref:c-type cytochrome n=1 Tax=Pollutimonas bauzanensis TaxID=658167 RepID=UPI003341B60C
MLSRFTLINVSLLVVVASVVSAHAIASNDDAAAKPATESSSAQSETSADKKLYTVVDKNHVDANTLEGWKTWRALSCARCHGAQQEGMVGPSLIASLKTLSKSEFEHTIKEGRIEKGMPPFGGVPRVVENIDNLYAYLKGRSQGDIAPGRLEAIE